MPKLIAIQELRYASKTIMPNEEFEAESDKDALVLKAIGKAKDAVAPIKQQRVATKQMTAEEPPKPDSVSNRDEEAASKKRYLRRDMRPEE